MMQTTTAKTKAAPKKVAPMKTAQLTHFSPENRPFWLICLGSSTTTGVTSGVLGDTGVGSAVTASTRARTRLMR